MPPVSSRMMLKLVPAATEALSGEISTRDSDAKKQGRRLPKVPISLRSLRIPCSGRTLPVPHFCTLDQPTCTICPEVARNSRVHQWLQGRRRLRIWRPREPRRSEGCQWHQLRPAFGLARAGANLGAQCLTPPSSWSLKLNWISGLACWMVLRIWSYEQEHLMSYRESNGTLRASVVTYRTISICK